MSTIGIIEKVGTGGVVATLIATTASNFFPSDTCQVVDPNFGSYKGNLSWEQIVRMFCTSVMILFCLEFAFDAITGHFVLKNVHNKPDKDGKNYVLIAISLLTCSYVPGARMDRLSACGRFGLVSVGQLTAVTGILLEIMLITKRIWHMWLFAGMLIVFGVVMTAKSIRDIGCVPMIAENVGFSMLGLTAITLALFYLTFMNYFEKRETVAMHPIEFIHKIHAGVLLLVLAVFFALTSLNQLISEINRNSRLLRHIALHLMLVFSTVLPSRIINVAHSIVMERIQIVEQTKNYMRYILHEVRSPLSTVVLGLQCLLSDSGEEPSELYDFIQDCHGSCNVAMNILSDLLLYDKLENDMITLDLAPLNAKQFIIDCIRPFRVQMSMEGKNLAIDCELELDQVTIWADQHKLEQVLRNFMTNAIKFTPVGGTILVCGKFIASDEHPKNGVLRAEVTDTGAGVSLENIPKLFGKYAQIDASRLQGGKGSGLGLFLSRNIIELHKGKTGMHSAGEGQGSTFYFEIPSKVVPTNEVLKSVPSLLHEAVEDFSCMSPIEQVHTFDLDELCNVSLKLKEEENSPNKRVKEENIDKPLLNKFRGLSMHKIDFNRSFASCHSNSTAMSTSAMVKMRVLIVDDSIVTCKLMQRMLKTINAVATHVDNGPSAIECIERSLAAAAKRKFSPEMISKKSISDENGEEGDTCPIDSLCGDQFDVVIVDYHMPGMEGPEIIRRLRLLGFTGCIIANTASQAEEDMQCLMESGADSVLIKPFDLLQFTNTVQAALMKVAKG